MRDTATVRVGNEPTIVKAWKPGTTKALRGHTQPTTYKAWKPGSLKALRRLAAVDETAAYISR